MKRIAPAMLLFLTVCSPWAQPAGAGIPYEFWAAPQLTTTDPVSVCTQPDGAGFPLHNCMLFPGTWTDATIHVTMRNFNYDLVPDLPAEDIWLGPHGPTDLVFCANGSIADGPTDEQGRTSFSGPFSGGGHLDPAEETRLHIRSILGDYCVDCPPLDIFVNSPDINADHNVDLTDVVLFAQDYYGGYDYRSDFWWDGYLNLSDLVLLVQALGASCE